MRNTPCETLVGRVSESIGHVMSNVTRLSGTFAHSMGNTSTPKLLTICVIHFGCFLVPLLQCAVFLGDPLSG